MNKLKDNEIQICFQKHKSAKSIIYSWYKIQNKKCNQKVNLYQFTNKKEYGSINIPISIILKKKFWGFCRNKNPSEIHYWNDKSCTIYDIMNLISHEISHSAGFKNETTAIKIASISTFSLYILFLLFKNKIKKT